MIASGIAPVAFTGNCIANPNQLFPLGVIGCQYRVTHVASPSFLFASPHDRLFLYPHRAYRC